MYDFSASSTPPSASASSPALQPGCVLARTGDGHRAVLESVLPLTPPQWRLLLIVNGETPLGDLAGLSPAVARGSVIGPLLDEGLIEMRQPEPAPAARPAAWAADAVARRVLN